MLIAGNRNVRKNRRIMKRNRSITVWTWILDGLGSVLSSMVWLRHHVGSASLRRSWLVWFLLAPFIGSILGIIIYLIFLAGFMISAQTELKNEVVPMVLVALAGYNWRWVTSVLNRISEAFEDKPKT